MVLVRTESSCALSAAVQRLMPRIGFPMAMYEARHALPQYLRRYCSERGEEVSMDMLLADIPAAGQLLASAVPTGNLQRAGHEELRYLLHRGRTHRIMHCILHQKTLFVTLSNSFHQLSMWPH